MAVQPVVATTDDNAPPKKPLYEGSTQFRHWRYSEKQLSEIRVSLNSAAVSAIKHAFEVDLVRLMILLYNYFNRDFTLARLVCECVFSRCRRRAFVSQAVH